MPLQSWRWAEAGARKGRKERPPKGRPAQTQHRFQRTSRRNSPPERPGRRARPGNSGSGAWPVFGAVEPDFMRHPPAQTSRPAAPRVNLHRSCSCDPADGSTRRALRYRETATPGAGFVAAKSIAHGRLDFREEDGRLPGRFPASLPTAWVRCQLPISRATVKGRRRSIRDRRENGSGG